MNNRKNSVLLMYIKSEIMRRGKFNLNNAVLAQAQSALNNRITNCCLYQAMPKTKSNFLKGFYGLLNSMNTKADFHKLAYVKTFLDNAINCCN